MPVDEHVENEDGGGIIEMMNYIISSEILVE